MDVPCEQYVGVMIVLLLGQLTLAIILLVDRDAITEYTRRHTKDSSHEVVRNAVKTINNNLVAACAISLVALAVQFVGLYLASESLRMLRRNARTKYTPYRKSYVAVEPTMAEEDSLLLGE